jgi:hypothetical protein
MVIILLFLVTPIDGCWFWLSILLTFGIGKHDVGHLSHTPSTGKKSGRSSATPNRSVQGTSQRPGAISRQSIPE